MIKLIIITLILLCTLLILGYTWWETSHSRTEHKEAYTTYQSEKSVSIGTEETIIEKQIKLNQPEIALDIKDTGIESLPIQKSIQTLNPFEEVDIDALQSHIKPLQGVEPLYAVKMKKNSISNSHIGDTMLLPSIDGNSYEMVIKDKSHSATGNTTIHGEYSDNGIVYHSILTEGRHASFISMTTPTGSYEVNIMETEGYIYASTDIENKKIDYKKSDTIMAPIKEDKESLE